MSIPIIAHRTCPLDAPENSRVLGLSSDGSVLVYSSAKKLYIVDLVGASVLKEIPLSFFPVGIVWP